MEGAVGTEAEQAGTALAGAREAVAQAEAARDALVKHDSRTLPARVPAVDIFPHISPSGVAAPEPRSHVVECERHLRDKWFWPLMALLILADFFANAPLFSELFPANRALDRVFQDWQDSQAPAASLLDLAGLGFREMFGRIVLRPEPAILAFSVVVFFVFLGHALGGQCRTLFALWKFKREEPGALISQAWRQAAAPAIAATVGILLTVGVLGWARSEVKGVATQRFAAAQQRTAEAEQAYQRARQATVDTELSQRREAAITASAELQYRQERLDYAQSIDAMNLPIAGLNLVLVISATIAGYFRERRKFDLLATAPADDEEFARAKQAEREALDRVRLEREEEMRQRAEERRTLTDALAQNRSRAREALGAAETSLHRAAVLLDADLFRDWAAKAERLGKMIPLFRSENARLRGLDVEDIKAFRRPIELSLPIPDAQERLHAPSALSEHIRSHGELHHLLSQLAGEAPLEGVASHA